MKTEQQLKDLCLFFKTMENRMMETGRLLIALHARGQYRKYHRQLAGKWPA
ncbi:hypothetical protein [Paenibacillus illinoisensis]|uniref:hypothetical protein n=1 Tax=Paenibacillus illinoisensis TaxID=59845 RepID=UPI00301BFEC4